MNKKKPFREILCISVSVLCKCFNELSCFKSLQFETMKITDVLLIFLFFVVDMALRLFSLENRLYLSERFYHITSHALTGTKSFTNLSFHLHVTRSHRKIRENQSVYINIMSENTKYLFMNDGSKTTVENDYNVLYSYECSY